ncbi:MAG: GAF domain-containing protein [Planctomycetes bacterium]|nr:GAF domain-containing protein [Planctomycetota bacterium]
MPRHAPGTTTRMRRHSSARAHGYVQLLAQAAYALAEGEPARSALASVLREAMTIVRADRAALCFLAPASGLARCVASIHVSPAFRRALTRCFPTLDHRALFDAPEGLHSASVPDDPRWKGLSEAARKEGIRSVGIFPLRFRETRLGFVTFFCDSPRECQTEDVAVGRALAAELALALHHARLVHEHKATTARLADRVSEVSLLADVTSKVSRSLDLEETLRAITENLARIINASDCFIFLADESAQALRLAAVSPAMRPQTQNVRIGYHEPSGAVQCYIEKKPVVSEDTQHDARLSPRMVQLTGAKAVLFVPLLLGDRSIGVMAFDETRRKRVFTAEEISRCRTVASQVAVAVNHARLYEDLRRSHEELVRAQSQVIASTRLAAIGEMSAVIAHEIRNPLGIIQNSIEMLRQAIPAGSGRDELFTVLGQETRRLNRMLSDFLIFSRQKRPVRVDYDLTEAIRGVCDLAQRDAQWAPTLRLERRGPPPGFVFPLDLDLFKQALFNLVMNAVQAMPDGGTLTVSAEAPETANGPLILVVADTGTGIPPELQEKVFQPFFSTRPRGTGLGLSIVKQIVEAHGGGVSVESGPGKGTRLTTVWPRPGAAAPSAAGDLRPAAGGPGISR